jgi:outer membrane protein OmpA-like peptidoglycan-associated protein
MRSPILVVLAAAVCMALAACNTAQSVATNEKYCNPVLDGLGHPVQSGGENPVIHAGSYPCPPVAAAPQPKKFVISGDVLFDFDKYVIKESEYPELDRIAQELKANPNAHVEVDGYTDSIGTVEYNLKLSERRANAVAQHLEKDGIPAASMTTRGFGKDNPVAPNTLPNGKDNPEGRAKNRRVEILAQ